MGRIYDDMPDFPVLIATGLTRLQEESGLNGKKFAKRIGIPEPTLTRFKKGECKLDSTYAKAMLGIVITDPIRYAELMIHYFPDDAEVWEAVFAKHKYSGSQGGVSIHNLVRKDSIYYYVYSFAGLDRGLPLSVVEHCWGLLGMQRVQHLVDTDLLRIEEDIVWRENKNHTYGDLETVKHNIGQLIEDFPLTNIIEKTGSLMNIINNLNDKGVTRMKKITHEYGTKVLDVMEDPQYRGTIPFSFSSFSGKMKNSGAYTEAIKELDGKKQDQKNGGK